MVTWKSWYTVVIVLNCCWWNSESTVIYSSIYMWTIGRILRTCSNGYATTGIQYSLITGNNGILRMALMVLWCWHKMSDSYWLYCQRERPVFLSLWRHSLAWKSSLILSRFVASYPTPKNLTNRRWCCGDVSEGVTPIGYSVCRLQESSQLARISPNQHFSSTESRSWKSSHARHDIIWLLRLNPPQRWPSRRPWKIAVITN